MRQITDSYFVSPQIDPADAEALKEVGITMVIDNRPDAEVPPSHQAASVGEAMQAAGIRFEVLPITHQTLNAENVAAHAALIAEAPGPVLAYCASGTRSTIVWALGQAGKRSSDEIVSAAAQAGYDLAGLRPTLDAMAEQKA